MEQRFSGLQQRKILLTQSLMLLMLRLLLVVFFFSISSLYALPGTQWIRDVGTWQQALAQQCCKSLDKPAKQARMLTGGFELKYSFHAQEIYQLEP